MPDIVKSADPDIVPDVASCPPPRFHVCAADSETGDEKVNLPLPDFVKPSPPSVNVPYPPIESAAESPVNRSPENAALEPRAKEWPYVEQSTTPTFDAPGAVPPQFAGSERSPAAPPPLYATSAAPIDALAATTATKATIRTILLNDFPFFMLFYLSLSVKFMLLIFWKHQSPSAPGRQTQALRASPRAEDWQP